MSALMSAWYGIWLRWQIVASRHTAWPYVAGAVLIGALLLIALILLPTHRDVLDLRSRVAALPTRAGAAAVTPSARDDKGASIDRQVALVLGEESTPTASLERLFTLARQHGLRLRRAEYKPSNVRVLSVQAIQVSVPLDGEYAQLRAWMFDVLASMPQASIDRIAYRRELVTTGRLQADVVLTLWRQDGKRADSSTGPDKTASMQRQEGRP